MIPLVDLYFFLFKKKLNGINIANIARETILEACRIEAGDPVSAKLRMYRPKLPSPQKRNKSIIPKMGNKKPNPKPKNVLSGTLLFFLLFNISL